MSNEPNFGDQPNTGVLPPKPVVVQSAGRPLATGKAIFMSSNPSAPVATPMRIIVDVSPDLDAIIDNMADELDESKSTTILRALALLKTALEAKRKGERLVIVNDAENVERDLVF